MAFPAAEPVAAPVSLGHIGPVKHEVLSGLRGAAERRTRPKLTLLNALESVVLPFRERGEAIRAEFSELETGRSRNPKIIDLFIAHPAIPIRLEEIFPGERVGRSRRKRAI